MSEATWWRHLKGDPTSFLLAEDEPGVVWRCLVEVLGRPHDSPAVVRARLAARENGAAARLLAQQNPLGFWGSPVAYGARWGGTSWHFMALGALGADPEDPRVDRAAEVLLEQLQPRSGGFSAARGRPPAACFTAEVCAAMARFGLAHHPRVREAVAWLAERDGGEGLWSCPELRHLVGGACPVAAVAVLRFVAELPPPERSQVARLSQRAGRGLVERKLFLEGNAPRGWWVFGHPALGRTDLLDALWALARLGWPAEPPVLAALLGALGRQDGAGRWAPQQAAPFGEPVGQPSRWLTLKALVALAAYGDALGPAREVTT
ncbi:MAG TPA: prenyltransferase/squalene oxidase repeat-containing protein [Thermoanaerobaculaceae bacterium]|nr:prenyltransferase/squalene oxidase repeat-containing protein [Thermoanaerobaculaceae bacterium]